MTIGRPPKPAFRRSKRWTGLAVAGLALCTLAWSGSVAAQTIEEFPLPTAGSSPNGIVLGPDGALWFTEYAVNGDNGAPHTGSKIGRITTEGAIAEFPLPVAGSSPQAIVAGPDGALWFTEAGDETGTPNAVPAKVGRITVGGAISEFAIPVTPNAGATGGAMTLGSDGALWFPTGFDGNTGDAIIGRITTGGDITVYPIPTSEIPAGITTGPDGALWLAEEPVAGTAPSLITRITPSGASSGASTPYEVQSAPAGITAGPDGALWFIASFSLGRITTDGTVTSFPIFSRTGSPNGIAPGPDGALWFFEADANDEPVIGRITTGGTNTEFPIPTVGSVPDSIVAGPDGAMWFTEFSGGKIGRIGPVASASPLVAAVLPSSRSVQAGATATAFATIINSGTSSADSCAIAPVTGTPANFLYQTTIPATNALTGTANTPVTIPAGGSQSFFVAFTTDTPFVPTDTVLGFDCANLDAAQSVSGLNTLLLSSSIVPVPDIIALSVTPSADGVLDIGGSTGSAGFAVASADVGAAGSITASTDTGSATLPLALTLCQTDPMNGQCMAPPASSVSLTVDPSATATFSVFAAASGAVTFAPANNRIFVRFTDSDGATRGTTSVAVRTQ